MQETWNLDALYQSFDDDAFAQDIQSLKDNMEQFSNWAVSELQTAENAPEKMLKYIEFESVIGTLLTKITGFADLTLSTDADNGQALRYIEQADELITHTTKPEALFSLWLKKIKPLDDIISSNEKLQPYAFFLKEIAAFSAYTLSQEEETVIAKMENTGSKAWAKLQDNTTATLLVDIVIDGAQKKLPLPEVRNMAYDQSATVRKNAYESELAACKRIARVSAACLNGIKGEVLTLCTMRGFSSPLDMTLLQSRMDRDALEAMISAIEEELPAFRDYFRRKATLLGYSGGLPFYDLFAPLGDVALNFTYKEAVEFVVEHFSSFSQSLGDYAKKAAQGCWIDVKPKAGKRGGAFCQNIHPIKESRILLNFTGSFNDILTLAHELGHGYHGECLNDVAFVNSDYPMPIAETASTFCEGIITRAALEKVDKAQQITILENDISSQAQVIVDILSRYQFESKVFELRKDGSISTDELNGIMTGCQKQTYGDGLDESNLHPYMWVVKPHYYDANYNFYNFPYAFGQLFSKGLHAKALEMGDRFAPLYEKMLTATGSNNLNDVAAIAGIDITDKSFWRTSLSLIKQDIKRFIELTN